MQLRGSHPEFLVSERLSIVENRYQQLRGPAELKSKVRIDLAVERTPGVIPRHGAGEARTECQQFRGFRPPAVAGELERLADIRAGDKPELRNKVGASLQVSIHQREMSVRPVQFDDGRGSVAAVSAIPSSTLRAACPCRVQCGPILIRASTDAT